MLPLDGILVVALEQAVAAPLATRQLADLGARVVKVERPGAGDFARHYDDHVNGLATYFVWLNRGKESVAVDSKQPLGREALERLLARADVFVQNLAPGAAARQGLAAHQLVERFPRLVACDVSGFGEGGPSSHKRAYDLVVQAETGSIAITGTPEAPAKPGVAVADIGVGMHCYASVLAALLERERTGRGKAIAVSMFDTLADWMQYSLYFTRYTGRDHLPVGVGHHAIVPYGAYATADGQTVVLGCQHDAEWVRLCTEVLGRPDLAGLGSAGRVERRAELDAVVGTAMAACDFDDAVAALDRAGIANGRLNTPRDLLDHPHLAARDRWRTVDTAAGPVPALLPPAVAEGWETPMGRVPALGEHTRPVLAELGYDTRSITALEESWTPAS